MTAATDTISIPPFAQTMLYSLFMFAALALLAIIVGYCVYRSLHPAEPQPYLLPNGMFVHSLSDLETAFLYDEIFVKNTYGQCGITLKRGDTVVDAGANIGMFSMWVYQKCQGAADIHAFEPMPTTYNVLELNAKNFGNGRIHTYNHGLSEEEESVTFEHHPNMSIWSTSSPTLAADRIERVTTQLVNSLYHNKPWLRLVPLWFSIKVMAYIMQHYSKIEKVQCELKRLGDVIEKQSIQKIDLLKADVEGAEFSVLKGVYDHQWPRIQQIALELESHRDVYKVRDFLRSKGFHVYWTSTPSMPGNEPTELSTLYARRETCTELQPDEEGYVIVDNIPEQQEVVGESKKHQ